MSLRICRGLLFGMSCQCLETTKKSKMFVHCRLAISLKALAKLGSIYAATRVWSASPSGEERGLLSRTAAGDRVYGQADSQVDASCMNMGPLASRSSGQFLCVSALDESHSQISHSRSDLHRFARKPTQVFHRLVWPIQVKAS